MTSLFGIVPSITKSDKTKPGAKLPTNGEILRSVFSQHSDEQKELQAAPKEAVHQVKPHYPKCAIPVLFEK